MDKPRITVETIVWIAILALALGLRLLNLGEKPLSDQESDWALQALSLAPGATYIEPVPSGSQASYISLTGLVFGVLGSNNFLARVVPAIAGVLLCLAPYFLRSRIGHFAALIMSTGLALDPAMVAFSRLAGGPMPAIGFGVLGLCLLADRKTLVSGIFLGLALLSGPAALQGILIVVLTWAIARLIPSKRNIQPVEDESKNDQGFTLTLRDWKVLLLGSLGSILVFGTLFGFHVPGLGAWVAALPEYLAGWVSPAGVPALRLLAALFIYQPIAVTFGVGAAVRGWSVGDSRAQWSSLFLLIALCIALFYPARQMGDLLWALIALWALASLSLADLLPIGEDNKAVVWVQAAIVFVLLALFWLNLAGLNLVVSVESAYRLRWLVLIGVLLLIGLLTVLIGFGWSWSTASKGLVWGLIAALGVYGVSGMWAASQPSRLRPISIWDPAPVTGEADLFLRTVTDLSEWSTGQRDSIEILLIDVPSMRWLFRKFPNARYTIGRLELSSGETPALVVTRKSQDTPALAAAYRGQDFGWWRFQDWSSPTPLDWTAWLAYRKEPARQEDVILWARSDLFPGLEVGVNELNVSPDPIESQPEESPK